MGVSAPEQQKLEIFRLGQFSDLVFDLSGLRISIAKPVNPTLYNRYIRCSFQSS